MSLIGVQNWSKQLDQLRGVPAGQTVEFLEQITSRRNRIAHSADRQGFGRAQLTIEEARDGLDSIVSVVGAMESLIT